MSRRWEGRCWGIDVNWDGAYPPLPGIELIKRAGRSGLSRDGLCTGDGGSSGYQAINLAYILGADTVLLLGYDMQWTGGKAHWFGKHPEESRFQNTDPLRFVASYRKMHPEKYGLKVINCSRATALDMFPRMAIDEALAHV